MKTLRNKAGVSAIAIACLALPSAAGAETVVPPENSAATQYTEAIPTGGGRKDAGKTGGGKEATPAEVLGAGKAKKLKKQGDEGRAAAEVAAETAPSSAAGTASPPPATKPPTGNGPSTGGDGNKAPASEAEVGGSAVDRKATPAPAAADPLAAEPASSGFGEVLGQATGSSASGQLGPLLPLLILGTILWSLLFAWRHRRQAE